MISDHDARPVTARWAVSALFLVSGSLVASIAPRLPAIRDALHLSNAEVGLAVAAGPLGGLIAGAMTGAIVARLGAGASPRSPGAGGVSRAATRGPRRAPAPGSKSPPSPT